MPSLAWTFQALRGLQHSPNALIQTHALRVTSANLSFKTGTYPPHSALFMQPSYIARDLHSASACMLTMQKCSVEQSSGQLQQAVQVLGELVDVRVAAKPRCQLRLCHQLLSLASTPDASDARHV